MSRASSRCSAGCGKNSGVSRCLILSRSGCPVLVRLLPTHAMKKESLDSFDSNLIAKRTLRGYQGRSCCERFTSALVRVGFH
jgi:hypothetical protein